MSKTGGTLISLILNHNGHEKVKSPPTLHWNANGFVEKYINRIVYPDVKSDQ